VQVTLKDQWVKANSTRRIAAAVILCFVATIVMVAQAPVQIEVDTQLVTLDFFVDDASGKAITTLTRDDLVVLEDGQPRPIQYFESAENPYNILLLFDRSSSTEDQWPFLAGAVSNFVRSLPERHQVALAAFDDKPEMLLTWRSAREFTRRAQVSVESSGTDVYRALEWGIQESRRVKGRKGIIVFTDGVDNRLSKKLVSFDKEGKPLIAPQEADSDFQKMLKIVAEAHVPIYFVAVNTDKNPDPNEEFNQFKQQLRVASRERMEVVANRSNGSIHFPQKTEEVGALYEEILRTLGYGYSIGFAPAHTAHDGSFHRIEVRTRDRNLRVNQLRDGYDAR
jgi:Ca-activated chloride channel family protein